jgi:23S rRNA (adenine2030-N6)-methyltransferase
MIPARQHDPNKKYEHRYHVGNVGDAFKHSVLLAVMDALPSGRPRTFVETHAAAGFYRLQPNGEWTEGVGHLMQLAPERLPSYTRALLHEPPMSRFRQKDGSYSHYPGSPLLVVSRMQPEDRLFAVELEEQPRQELTRRLGDDARVSIVAGDGLSEAVRVLGATSGPALVHIDPAYADKKEWDVVADAMVAMHQANPAAWLLLWYPFKGFSRPPALQRRLTQAGVRWQAWDLVTSPEEERRNRLHGSGMLLVGGTAELAATIAGQAATLAPLLSFRGEWWLRVAGSSHSSP